MSIDILMPALSPTMTQGTLAKWHKNVGDAVNPGDVLADIETDKATMEVEAVDAGVIEALLIPEGTAGVAVNTRIAVLRSDDEPIHATVVTSDATSKSGMAGQGHQGVVDGDAIGVAPVGGGGVLGGGSAAALVGAARSSLDQAATPSNEPSEEDMMWEGPRRPQTVREALRDAMAEEMVRDPNVFVMGEEVAEYQGAYKVTQGLLQQFGAKRVVDTPITEHGFAGLAVGAAFYGLRPVVEFMTFNFAMQAIDQIINSAAKTLYMSGGQMGCPIVFRGPNGAAARVGAQHSQCYASWYAHCPGLKVVAPYDAADAKGLLKAAIRDPNPVVFLENELLYGQTFDVPVHDDFVLPLGKARRRRSGTDVTLVAFSIMVGRALEAADILASQGISADVLDLRTLRPLDTQAILESVARTNRIVCVEEGWPYAGIGSEIAALMMEEGFDLLDAPMERVCAVDVPLPYAKNLETLALPQTQQIVEAVQRVCGRLL